MKTMTSSPLRNRDFALLWSGQTVSSLGDGIFTIALTIVTLRIAHSPTALAYVFAARAVPSIGFSLLGGVVVDRASRRLVMLGSDAVRGGAVGLIALLASRGELRLWELILMSVIFGTADAFFSPASTAIIPELLDGPLLAKGNALGQLSNQLSRGIVGPAFGGFIVGTVGIAWSFSIDAVSFAGSGICLLVMRAGSKPATVKESPLRSAAVGLRYVLDRNWLKISLVGGALANFVGFVPLGVLLPLLVRTSLKGSASQLGFVFAAGGSAGIIISLIVAKIGSPRRFVSATWIAYTAGSLSIALLAFASNIWVAGIMVSAEVGLFLYGDILWTAMLQDHVPKELLGRVSSVVYLFAFSLGPLGLLAGGFAASLLGIRHAILASGLIAAAICAVVPFAPGVRDPEILPALTSS